MNSILTGAVRKAQRAKSLIRELTGKLSHRREDFTRKPVKVCTVVFSGYPRDVRVRREAEAMVNAGMSVELICFRDRGDKQREMIDGVHVRRVMYRDGRGSKLNYLWDYGRFLVLAFLAVSWRSLQTRFDLVHIHNMPDILILAALIPKLRGAKVILDLHDPTPEVYRTKYELSSDHLFVQCLVRLEQLSIRFADLVITPNRKFVERFVSRGCPVSKIIIVMNSPQPEVFHATRARGLLKRGPLPERDSFNLMFHGLIARRHGLDIALKSLRLIRSEMPGLKFHIYGGGDEFLSECIELIKDLSLERLVEYHGFVSIQKIVTAIAGSDAGIIPNRSTTFTEINFPVRIFEYLALGKPVIAPRTEGILDYFSEDSLFLFEAGSPESLAETILQVRSNTCLREKVLAKGSQVYYRHRWEVQRDRFIQQVDRLLARGSREKLKKGLSERRSVLQPLTPRR